MNIQIPTAAAQILQTLHLNGHEAYVVGGCVRDALLGRDPKDWDICTSASPEEMLQCFAGDRVILTGMKHGTVTVVKDREPYEVTTFRVDGSYTDNRHPDSVTFVKDVRQDLARRDFTVNAMAYNDRDGLVDCFGGQEDLAAGMIRCVGDPDARFQQDGLRIMRALRFASTYGFTLEEETAASAVRNAGLLQNIAAERLYSEMGKLLLGEGRMEILLSYPAVITQVLPQLAPAVGFEQRNPHHRYNVYDHIMHAVGAYPGRDAATLWALLLHDTGKPSCFSMDERGGHFYGHGHISAKLAAEAFARLKSDKKTADAAVELIEHHDAVLQPTEKCMRRWLNRIGPEQLERLLDIHEADVSAQAENHLVQRLEESRQIRRVLAQVLNQAQCFSLKDMQINGKDLIDIGVNPGKKVGEILQSLLDGIISGDLNNDREQLLLAAEKMK